MAPGGEGWPFYGSIAVALWAVVLQASLLNARLGSQLLAGPPARRPEEVVDRILAVQAQDARAFRLAIRARTGGACTAADLEAAMNSRRSVVASLCRGTLHLVGAEEYWWLHALVAPRLGSYNMRRLEQLGLPAVETARATEALLAAAQTPRRREEMDGVLDRLGVPDDPGLRIRTYYAASWDHHLVRGPVVDGAHCFVDAAEWLGPPANELDSHQAGRRLATRYLAGHAPAGPADLAAFTGLPLGQAKAALAAISDATSPAGAGLVQLAAAAAASELPGPRLLGGFDPVLHGWADRSFVTAGRPGITTTNGIFRPTILVDGQVVGTWKLVAGQLELRPFVPLLRSVVDALDQEAVGVADFLGLPPLRMSVLPL